MRWVWILAGVCAVLPAMAQLPFETVAVPQAQPLAKALAAMAEQTGVRFVGLDRLGEAGNKSVTATGPLPAALRALAEQTGVMISRVGVYDWAVAPPPPAPPRPLPQTLVGPVVLRTQGTWYPLVEAGGKPEDTVLQVGLGAEAGSLLDLARLADIEPASLQLTPEGAAPQGLLPGLYHAPDATRRRMGFRATLPFAPVGAPRAATLSGIAVLFEQVRWLGFEFQTTREQQIDHEDQAVTFQRGEALGDVWQAELLLRRPAAIGDETPWVDAALRDDKGVLRRPTDTAFHPRGPAEDDADERIDTTCTLSFQLPEGSHAKTLSLALLVRRRPWERVAFTLPAIPLPPRGPAAAR